MTEKKVVQATALLLAMPFGLCIAAPVAARDKSGDGLAALEQKLHGAWTGGPCDGQLAFHADGTYQRRQHGPAGNNSAGAWKVRWDALPPTLVLSCKTSDDPAYAGKSLEVRLLQLDNANLVFQHGKERPARYTRGKKQPPAGSEEKEAGVTRDELLGRWRSKEVTLVGGQSDLELKPNGKFTFENIDVSLGWRTTITGTWEVKGDRLVLTAEKRRQDGRESPIGPKKTEELSATRHGGTWILKAPDREELQKAAKDK